MPLLHTHGIKTKQQSKPHILLTRSACNTTLHKQLSIKTETDSQSVPLIESTASLPFSWKVILKQERKSIKYVVIHGTKKPLQ